MICVLFLCSTQAGCATLLHPMATTTSIALPHEREFRKGSLIFHSDADISENHPLFLELASFPEQVCRSLELPVTDRTIHIYLFKDRVNYEHYIQLEFKDIPSRRALFVKRPGTVLQKQDTLQVLCYWGDRIQDDLRHELTHATLHGVLHDIPLWLDEGLAMYFEVGVAAQGKHVRALTVIEPTLQAGNWKHDIDRLYALKEVNQMGLADYHEAWAWVHFLMQTTPERRVLILGYLKAMQRTKEPVSPLNLSNESLQFEDHLKKLLADRSSWPHG